MQCHPAALRHQWITYENDKTTQTQSSSRSDSQSGSSPGNPPGLGTSVAPPRRVCQVVWLKGLMGTYSGSVRARERWEKWKWAQEKSESMRKVRAWVKTQHRSTQTPKRYCASRHNTRVTCKVIEPMYITWTAMLSNIRTEPQNMLATSTQKLTTLISATNLALTCLQICPASNRQSSQQHVARMWNDNLCKCSSLTAASHWRNYIHSLESPYVQAETKYNKTLQADDSRNNLEKTERRHLFSLNTSIDGSGYKEQGRTICKKFPFSTRLKTEALTKTQFDSPSATRRETH